MNREPRDGQLRVRRLSGYPYPKPAWGVEYWLAWDHKPGGEWIVLNDEFASREHARDYVKHHHGNYYYSNREAAK